MPRILVINPNTTQSVTDLVLGHCRAVASPDVALIGATGAFGAAYIHSEAAFAIGGHAALHAFAEHGAGVDGVLLACFGDPGLFALREIAGDVPVVALADACMARAAELGRFAIVTGGVRWGPMLERLAVALGHGDALAQVLTVAPSGGQIAADPEASIALLADACRRAAAESGAASVILGGAGLAGLAARVQPRVPVPVLDSVIEGMRAIEALVRAPRPVAPSPATTSSPVPSTGLGAALAAKLPG